MVLALWTLALGAYTWFWLRKPIRPVHFPSNDLEVRSVAADAEVHEEPPIEGMLLMTLLRINGRLERAQRSGNNGKILRCLQSRLSCISHVPESSATEKLRIRE